MVLLLLIVHRISYTCTFGCRKTYGIEILDLRSNKQFWYEEYLNYSTNDIYTIAIIWLTINESECISTEIKIMKKAAFFSQTYGNIFRIQKRAFGENTQFFI